MVWTYNGEDVTSLPEGAIGFIYIITYSDGKKYIGSKVALSERRVKPLVGMRKNAVRTVLKETDWKKYNGSCKTETTASIVSKEILQFVSTRRTLTYLETKALFCNGAIEKEEYMNKNILGKFWDNCLDGEMK